MARRLLLLLLLPLFPALGPALASAQIYTPQSGAALSVSFQSERMAASRVIIFGEVRNSSGSPYERVVVLAEGLDDTGQVVSRGRAYILAIIPARGSASFEVRLLSSGRERRFRVGVEAYQLAGSVGTQSP